VDHAIEGQAIYRPKTWKPVAAGILDILCGLSATGFLLLILFIAYLSFQISSNSFDMGSWTFGISCITLAIAIITIVGGISAIRRKRWRLALTGGITALLSSLALGAVPLIIQFAAIYRVSGTAVPMSYLLLSVVQSLPTMLMGIAAITLTTLSKKEFQ